MSTPNRFLGRAAAATAALLLASAGTANAGPSDDRLLPSPDRTPVLNEELQNPQDPKLPALETQAPTGSVDPADSDNPLSAIITSPGFTVRPKPGGGLRVGSAGLRRDLILTDGSTAPEQRRARSIDQVLLLATASEPVAGVRSLAFDGEVRIECVPKSISVSPSVTVVDPIYEEATATSGKRPPVLLAKQYVLDVPAQHRRCPTGTRFFSLELRLQAESTDTFGGIRRTPFAIIDAYGPDTVRAATFNLYNPGRHQDSVFERWGQQLVSQTDVVFLQEVPDERRARLVASAAGLPYTEYFVNTAIASRSPLRNVIRRDVHGSIIISAETDLGGYPHQVVAAHFTTQDAGGMAKPWVSSAWRLDASRELLGLLQSPPRDVIVGGDFNAYSGVGPQIEDHLNGTREIDLLRGAMTDVFGSLVNQEHCSNQRIDFLFVRGAYTPAEYDSCSPEAVPSDHPFVWARLTAG